MNVENTMNALGAIADAANPKEPFDFTVDGILYCGVCEHPKQVRINMPGIGERVQATTCACAKRKEEECSERERAAKREDRRKKIFHSIDYLCKATFGNDDGKLPDVVDRLKRYVEIFDSTKKDGYGIILSGASGTGKTYHACQVANALIDRDKHVLFTDFYRFENSAALAKDKTAHIESYAGHDLVVLDDFGAWTKLAYDNGLVYQLINHLYVCKVPTVITTNMTVKQLQELSSVPLYRRILERGRILSFSDDVNRSKLNAKSNYDKYSELLDL